MEILATNPIECVICRQLINDRPMYQFHRRCCTFERKYPCEHCHRQFSGIAGLKQHLTRFHHVNLPSADNQIRREYYCRSCQDGPRNNSLERLLSHISSRHGGDTDEYLGMQIMGRRGTEKPPQEWRNTRNAPQQEENDQPARIDLPDDEANRDDDANQQSDDNQSDD